MSPTTHDLINEINRLDQELGQALTALIAAEKETHICGPASPYSEDECPGHRIRGALKELGYRHD
jgi:hypothetical protein